MREEYRSEKCEGKMEEAGIREGFLEEVAFQLALERDHVDKLNANPFI